MGQTCVRWNGLLTATVSLVALSGALSAQGVPPLVVGVPQGFQVEKLVSGLTFPTAVGWDDTNQLYVLEAGGAFLDLPVPARILRVEHGATTVVADLEGNGVAPPAVGLAWLDGGFLITHREPSDFTGAVSKVTLAGPSSVFSISRLLTGFLDSRSEHQLNDIRVGPDGRVYFAAGPAGNSAVMGLDVAPFIELSPDLHTKSCEDIVLTGLNFETPDFRTPEPGDKVRTGAYVPFGVETMSGQIIPGTRKCGGAIHVFDASDPEGTLDVWAWGLRNVIGLAWSGDGGMLAAVNGYDVRGSRPVRDRVDATYEIPQGAWFGWPDFTGALRPVTQDRFDVPDSLQAPIFVDGKERPKGLYFLIDHAASGLAQPDRKLLHAAHPVDSSPSKIDVAPAGWGPLAGDAFIAEWGDLAPVTSPLLNEVPGYRVVRVKAGGGKPETFMANTMPGPASAHGALGQGIERPFDVRFGPDGALYVVDFGVAVVDPANDSGPYEFVPATGAIWRVKKL